MYYVGICNNVPNEIRQKFDSLKKRSRNCNLNWCNTMYILASDFFEKDDKYILKARKSCCVKLIFSL